MKKRVFYTEAAYVIGLCLLAMGTALNQYSGWGISMVVAPAYLVYLRLSEVAGWFSFGMAEYLLQAVVLALLSLVMGKGKRAYLFSFVTAVLYGLVLDGCVLLAGMLPDVAAGRAIGYILGVLLAASGVCLLFHSYLPPAAYELFVKEVSCRTGIRRPVMKTIYDCASVLLATLMSLLFWGDIRGVGIGTVICAAINGPLIGALSKYLLQAYRMEDKFALRNYFMEREDSV